VSGGEARGRVVVVVGILFAILMAGLYAWTLQEDEAPAPTAAARDATAPPRAQPPPTASPGAAPAVAAVVDPTPEATPEPEETPAAPLLEPETPIQELVTVSGIVRDSADEPVKGARIIVHAGPRKLRLRSDADGRFKAPYVPAGSLVAWAERRDGALSVSSDKVVMETEDGRDYEVEFVLPTEMTGGLGVNLRPHEEGALVSSLVPDAQGEFIGLQRGDLILEVNGESIDGLPLGDVARMIKGPEGSTGTITVRRARTNAQEEIVFEREFVEKQRRRPR